MYYYRVEWTIKHPTKLIFTSKDKKFGDFIEAINFAKNKYKTLKSKWKKVIIEDRMMYGSSDDIVRDTKVVNVTDIL